MQTIPFCYFNFMILPITLYVNERYTVRSFDMWLSVDLRTHMGNYNHKAKFIVCVVIITDFVIFTIQLKDEAFMCDKLWFHFH